MASLKPETVALIQKAVDDTATAVQSAIDASLADTAAAAADQKNISDHQQALESAGIALEALSAEFGVPLPKAVS